MRSPLRARLAPLFTLLALSVGATGLTACSPSDAANGDGSNGGAGNAAVAVGGERFGTADAATAALGSDAAPGVFPRTLTHARGTVTLEKRPERVVVLDTGELDDVLTLGIKPVGMVTTRGANPVPSYLADQVEGIESVGTIQNVNVERIAELKPDLILGSQLRVDKQYNQLAAIAPTVLSIRPGYPWKENFRLVGDALGMETRTVEVLNAYADNAAALGESVSGDPTISLVRFMPGRLRLYANKSLIGVILQDAGLARPANQNIDDLATEISRENIADANGDFVFYSSYGQPSVTGQTDVLASPGWAQLPAVQDGNAFEVDDDVWFLGLGPTGADLILTQLGQYLAS